ncbi:hypothetical protein [Rhizobium sp. Root1220]|uniref:hypothetical protein n=1 Tax=Rhizobium sp. Root1220 TaxID=1736432 RepID=UPI001FCDA20F|nr:hypothetical protein [Rhizobium sp. Root1220]
MQRRTLLTLGTGLAVSVLTGFKPAVTITETRRGPGLVLADMEPDGLTRTYRRYRLLLVGQRDDETAGDLSESAVNVLERFLPASRARLTRAADTRRVGVLIGTHQQDIAVMARESAEALFAATPPFTDIRNLPLRLIVSFGSHVLVSRTDFEDRHAYTVAQTLTVHKNMLARPVVEPDGPIPVHRGAGAYFIGKDI